MIETRWLAENGCDLVSVVGFRETALGHDHGAPSFHQLA